MHCRMTLLRLSFREYDSNIKRMCIFRTSVMMMKQKREKSFSFNLNIKTLCRAHRVHLSRYGAVSFKRRLMLKFFLTQRCYGMVLPKLKGKEYISVTPHCTLLRLQGKISVSSSMQFQSIEKLCFNGLWKDCFDVSGQN